MTKRNTLSGVKPQWQKPAKQVKEIPAKAASEGPNVTMEEEGVCHSQPKWEYWHVIKQENLAGSNTQN